jgi:putative flavoprotein involved in K+ transport
VLFQVATARRRKLDAGQVDPGGVSSLGDVVMVPTVQAARQRGVLHARPMFDHVSPDGAVWADGTHRRYDAIVWCTGFRPALSHLAGLGLRTGEGRIPTVNTQAAGEPRLHLLGYGDWTGPASATVIGVGRTACDAVAGITTLWAPPETPRPGTS